MPTRIPVPKARRVYVAPPVRPLRQALKNGLLCKCPKCGEGRLFSAYLKINDTCPVCGEELFHHRADDLPPYLAIILVGHIVIGILIEMEMHWPASPIVYLSILLPLALILPLALLPSIKGFVVALQWANRMHGFDRSKLFPDPAEPDLSPEFFMDRDDQT